MHEEKDEKLFKNESLRKIFEDVFDSATIQTIHELARKKYIDQLEYVISTGKEGNVFRCRAGKGHYALKIYKIETSDFRHMADYIIGDERFKKVRKDKLEIVKAWTKKEQRNLFDLNNAGIRVPLPITFNRNCLVMEFIGKNGVPAPRAKEKQFKEPEKQYTVLCDYLARMYIIGLVHSDLSEYNILNNDEELVIIDVGQTITVKHPNAREFFERDINNLSKWFKKQGVKTNYDEMYAKVKMLANKIETKNEKEKKSTTKNEKTINKKMKKNKHKKNKKIKRKKQKN